MTLVNYYISNAFRAVCRMRLACVATLVFMSALPVCRAVAGAWPAGEDGSRLWLRMGPAVGDARIDAKDRSAVAKTAVRELVAFWKGGGVSLVKDNSLPDNDGFMIVFPDGDSKTVIRARRSVGLLYGAYELLRRQQMRSLRSPSASKSFVSMPALADRVMCHYDGAGGKAVGGRTGESLLQWNEIDGRMGTMGIDQRERLITYARANASVGINGCVVDTTGAGRCVLAPECLDKVKAVAGLLRSYGIKTYLPVGFASPVAVGGLKTAEPSDQGVRDWWKKKVKEIYTRISDFGGFFVTDGREAAHGADGCGGIRADWVNMLAEAVASYKGVVILRCSLYGAHASEDSVGRAVTELKALDGKLAPNVVLQSNYGSFGLMPYGPYSPVLAQMNQTQLWAELPIAEENFVPSHPWAYLATARGVFFGFAGRLTDAKAVQEAASPAAGLSAVTGITGAVGMVGMVGGWRSLRTHAAGWYAFGRKAWNPSMPSDSIAREWYAQTFAGDTAFAMHCEQKRYAPAESPRR